MIEAMGFLGAVIFREYLPANIFLSGINSGRERFAKVHESWNTSFEMTEAMRADATLLPPSRQSERPSLPRGHTRLRRTYDTARTRRG